MQRITRISPWSAGKVCAALFFLSGVFTMVFALLLKWFFDRGGEGDSERFAATSTILAGPLVAAIYGLVFGLIAAWFYNYTVQYTGGLAFETDENRGFRSIDELP